MKFPRVLWVSSTFLHTTGTKELCPKKMFNCFLVGIPWHIGLDGFKWRDQPGNVSRHREYSTEWKAAQRSSGEKISSIWKGEGEERWGKQKVLSISPYVHSILGLSNEIWRTDGDWVEEWACSLQLLVSYSVTDNGILSKHHPLHTQLETVRFSLICSLGSFRPWSVGCNGSGHYDGRHPGAVHLKTTK